MTQRFTKRNPCIFRSFKLENRSRTTCSRFLQSFALPDEAVQLHTHDTKTQEERKMKENSGQSKPWFLLSFVRASFVFLTTLTIRALHKSPILSTPLETTVKKKKQDTVVAHMPTHTLTFHDNHYSSHHCFSLFFVSPRSPRTIQKLIPGRTTTVKQNNIPAGKTTNQRLFADDASFVGNRLCDECKKSALPRVCHMPESIL